jgi:hypothetical protein
MMTERANASGTKYVSLAIFAWNEEAAIGSTLNSLFEQSLFAELSQRGVQCEINCVVNGCTDRTPVVAAEIFEHQRRYHPFAGGFSCAVANLKERGKVNAWNQFVHSFSAREARFLFMMDADILIHQKETLWHMLRTLEEDPRANVSVDIPRKDIFFKSRKSLLEHLSVGTSRVTLSAPAQLCGQLYCVRAEIARNIYLPRDLAACEDGFIKALVCTDSLTGPVLPERIRVADGAEHTFEAYTTLPALLRNQKRQIIGQTIVHLLVDEYLKGLPLTQRLHLADALKQKEAADPGWLKRLIAQHLERTRFFWQLYPGFLGQRFRALAGLDHRARLRLAPAAIVGSLLSLIPCFMAHASLKRGVTNYWPKARRMGLQHIASQAPPV